MQRSTTRAASDGLFLLFRWAAHVLSLSLGASSTFGCPGADKVALNIGQPPSTANIKCPVLLVLSAHGSAKDRNCALAFTMHLTMPNRSKVLRARRSIRVTVTTSPGPVWPGADTILVANKIDLVPAADIDLSPSVLPVSALPVSALNGEGVDRLLTVLGERVAQTYRIEAPVLTRARHRQALEEAAASLRRSFCAELPELHAEDLRLALRSLGRITGAVDVEDLLDVIFRDFCIGK